MLNISKLTTMLSYDPFTGIFYWRQNRRAGARAGDVAGSIKSRGGHKYIEITIDRVAYQAHRLAFLFVIGRWPRGKVDHWDRDGMNNKWANLRNASNSQNAANSKVYSTNTSGFKGVTFHKRNRRWQAAIKHHGKNHYLGLFDTAAAAHAAYMCKARELFGPFARAA